VITGDQLYLIPSLVFLSTCTYDVFSAPQTNVETNNAIESKDQLGNKSGILEENIFEFSFGVGYRKDKLNWNEAGATVNILSELRWENLEIAQINAAAKFNFYTDWYLRGTLGMGMINSGNNQDSDYNGNNRTLEFSRANNKGGGVVRDASLGLGRTFRFQDKDGKNFLSVTPLLGLSIHQQQLTMTDGFQTLPATGTFPGLNSSYDAQWQGPWMGIDALLKTGMAWSLFATVEYHWADYAAHANWNLRPEFLHPVSFIHTATGTGILLSTGAHYLISKDWGAKITITAQQWHTGNGIDHTFFADGTVGFYRLNEVNWESTGLYFGMVRYF